MNSWAEKKCLTALMKLKGAKEGEWSALASSILEHPSLRLCVSG